MAKNPEQLVKTWGEDLTNFYNNEFYKQANGNRDEFIKHNIDRFGIPKGSSRKKEMEHYGSVFDKMNQQPKVKNWDENKYNDMIDYISLYRGDGVDMGDIQNQLLSDYGKDYEDLVKYALSKWAE